MIFYIKHRWWTALLTTVGVALLTWLAGGWQLVLVPTWPWFVQMSWGVGSAAGSIGVDGLLHESLKRLWKTGYVAAFNRHGEAVLGNMRWPEYLTGGLMAAVAEEPLFRGLMLPWVWSMTGQPWLAVVITGLVFAGCHWMRLSFFPFWIWALGEGLLFGALYVWFDSLIIPMIAHGLHDVIGFVVLNQLVKRDKWPSN